MPSRMGSRMPFAGTLASLSAQRTFVALLALIMVNQIGFGLITPVLPAYAKSFGLGAGDIGLVIGVYGFARFVANVPAGQVADRYGRRPVLIIGTAITAVASALIATAGDLPQLLVYRLLAGLGAATVLTGGQIMVGDIASPENRGRMMSTYQGIFLAGVGLGPLPGGLLADHFGLRAPFIAYAAFSALACVCALFLIRETRPSASEAATARESASAQTGSLGATATSAAFLLIGFVTFSQFFGRTGAIFAIVPLLGSERFALSASAIGFAQTIINVLNLSMVYFSGSLADRFGRKIVIGPASIVEGLAMFLWAWGPTPLTYFAAAAVWGTGAGLTGPTPAAYVADLSPPDVRARIFGMWRSVSDGGYIVGPVLLGFLAGRVGFNPPLLLTGTMVILSGVLFWVFAPEFHTPTARRAPAEAPRRT